MTSGWVNKRRGVDGIAQGAAELECSLGDDALGIDGNPTAVPIQQQIVMVQVAMEERGWALPRGEFGIAVPGRQPQVRIAGLWPFAVEQRLAPRGRVRHFGRERMRVEEVGRRLGNESQGVKITHATARLQERRARIEPFEQGIDPNRSRIRTERRPAQTCNRSAP